MPQSVHQIFREVAPNFVQLAHEIVWASVATVGPDRRPLTRILHPIWFLTDAAEGIQLRGWLLTRATRLKREHLKFSPWMSLTYWTPRQDTCSAVCAVRWHHDDATRSWLWEAFKAAPEPVGFDPAMVPRWNTPTDEGLAALELDPVRLRVYPGSTLLRGQGGQVQTWSRD